LIDNPVSVAPGFTLGNVHVMAGVPSVFQAMVATILPTLTGGAPLSSSTYTINRGEGDIAGPLGDLAKAFPALSIGSYPFQKEGQFGSNIVIRGADSAEVEVARSKLAVVFPK
jgi:molybdopterin-biosynthesis enzyme MoeA-like protein